MFLKAIKTLSLFKPTVRKAIKTIFSEFTPEEMKILESPDCAIPYMYTTLLKEIPFWRKSKYSMKEVRDIADVCIYSCRNHLDNPTICRQIYLVCSNRLLEN